ncbi:MAG TPA: nickel pincer cofactor biosynthesis protein LarB [Planctomycetaceae bacterium]
MPDSHPTPDATIDLARADRCGFPEVVYGPGKRPETVAEIFAVQQSHGQACLATRVDAEQVEAVRNRFPQAIANDVARTVRLAAPGRHEPPTGFVAVLTAGTTDRAVAEEAVETLRWMNVGVELIVDIGVAGPQRLLDAKPRFVHADAVVVAAGMEGALPSVVGGHVPCPVVAVPTSVGYGAAFGGIAALLGMLNSCASNVTVVNIDAGFKAGYVAGLIARRVVRK